ncbi:hypothetical protein, partial [Klebsiella aerogenes]|uniref:hypothetical protein n=1 Tax=Klebsiella aerogenes TaxID=548 RepID=UPI0021BA8053
PYTSSCVEVGGSSNYFEYKNTATLPIRLFWSRINDNKEMQWPPGWVDPGVHHYLGVVCFMR